VVLEKIAYHILCRRVRAWRKTRLCHQARSRPFEKGKKVLARLGSFGFKAVGRGGYRYSRRPGTWKYMRACTGASLYMYKCLKLRPYCAEYLCQCHRQISRRRWFPSTSGLMMGFLNFESRSDRRDSLFMSSRDFSLSLPLITHLYHNKHIEARCARNSQLPGHYPANPVSDGTHF